MKTMRSAAVGGAIAVAMMAAACGSDGNRTGGGGNDVPEIIAPFDFSSLPDPSPTPDVPLGPVYLADLTTPDGSPVISSGKCLGFTLTANEEGLYFTMDTTVDVGPFTNVETLLLDGTHLRVGTDATSNTCFYTPLFGTPGTWDVKVHNTDRTIELPGAITVHPTKLLDAGRVESDYRWSMDMVTDPEANAFEVPYDIDVYRVDFYNGTTSHSFARIEFFPTGPTALLPIMEFREPSHPQILTARGGVGLVFPKRGVNYVVVKDELGQGGPGATYELAMATQVATGAPTSDMCSSAPLITARTYYTSYDDLTPDFNPEGSAGCRDSLYGNPINAPGNDGVWRVKVPAGKQLRVSTYDDHINNVTYLLPATMSVGTNGCPARPTTCVRASGRFGGGNTDTLVYDNVSGVEEEFFLIHDSATVMTSGVGSFLFDVELFDKP